ncbi:helix-turn-helix transcriptional regulator [Natrarchaeobius sp. A-rgal3]|uniref:helix-turn-helix transcriptional regulator n=1 Tax=Natrarchaeobius versutus TaxID=1679078 RepID=UPI0035109F66
MTAHFSSRIPSDPLTTTPFDSVLYGLETGQCLAFGSLVPLVVGGQSHLAALVGIVALAVFGGALVLRNHIENRRSFAGVGEAAREEFVTDQERVQQLVSENGGRMKQSKIVDSVDWSKAKVSRLLAELEEDGQITKLRLGRENLVCLPDHEPTASKSPEQPKNE